MFIKRLSEKALLNIGNFLSHEQSFNYLDRIQDIPFLSEEEVKSIQFAKLKKLLNHSYEYVEYYRNLFDKNKMHPSDINSLEDFANLPKLTKNIIINNRKSLIAKNYSEESLIPSATGGSTGDPLNFYRTQEYVDLGRAGMWRSLQRCGWRPGENIAYVWGCSQEYYKKSELGRHLRATLNRLHFFDTFNASEENLTKWVERFRSIQPTVVFGYASSIDMLARYMNRHGIKIAGIKGVFTTAETLFPSARQNMAQAFKARIYNFYGSSEVLNVASECDHGNLHINSDFVHVEEGDGTGGGDNRKLIVTSLLNYGMPFLRYENGDMGKLLPPDAKCGCGLPFPMLDLNIGRVGCMISFPNNNTVSGHYFEYFIYGTNGIQEFQFHQKSKELLILRIVKNAEFSDATQEKLDQAEKVLKEKGGESVQLQIEFVEFIPLTSQGKHVYILSDLPKQ